MDFDINRVNKVFGGEAYLLTSGDDAVLVDSSYAVGVEGTIKKIEYNLKGRKLKHIFLSHSHYDHVMGSAAISEHFPEAKIYAHPKVNEIFKKHHAQSTMEELNRAAAADRDLPANEGWAEKLHVDVDVNDGDIIEAGDIKIRVLWSPGHTWDSISLYFENEDLFFSAESLGVPFDFPGVVPGFIVSYSDALDSINKAREIDPKYLVLPHSGVISGKDIQTYFDNGEKEARNIYYIIKESDEKGMSVDEIVEKLRTIYYKGNFPRFQPDGAFYANWIPLVTKLTERERYLK